MGLEIKNGGEEEGKDMAPKGKHNYKDFLDWSRLRHKIQRI